MLRFLQRLSPPFLLKLDRHLLLKYPQVWATKIHFLLFFGILWTLLVSLHAITQSISPDSIPNPETYFYLLFIPFYIGLGFWAFKVYLFRPERDFGEYSGKADLGNQLIYLLGIGLLALAPFMYGNMLVEKIDNYISQETFEHDINALTLGEYYMTGDWEYVNQGYHYHNEYFDQNPAKLEALKDQYLMANMANSPATHQEHIENYIQVWEKYAGHHFPYAPTRVLEVHLAQNFYYTTGFSNWDRLVEENFTIIERIKTNEVYIFQDHNGLNAIMAAILFVAFTFIIFVKTQWKQFLLALGLSLAGAAAVALLTELLDNALRLNYRMEEKTAFLISFAFFTVLLIQVYWGKNTRLMTQWKTVALTAVAGVMPVLMFWGGVLFLKRILRRDFGISQTDANITLEILVIFGICMLVWNVVFRERFRKLQSQPTKN